MIQHGDSELKKHCRSDGIIPPIRAVLASVKQIVSNGLHEPNDLPEIARPPVQVDIVPLQAVAGRDDLLLRSGVDERARLL